MNNIDVLMDLSSLNIELTIAPTPIAIDKTKFGISIDGLIGNIDSDGVLQLPTKDFIFDGSAIKGLVFPGLKSKFESTHITEVHLPNITSVTDQCLDIAFANCPMLRVIDLSNLESATGNYVCENLGFYCGNLVDLRLGKLRDIDGEYAFIAAFGGCVSLETVDLGSLEQILGQRAAYQMFYGCKNLKTVNISALRTISGSYATYQMFADNTLLEDINFESLTTINGNYCCGFMFRNNVSLKKIYFPSLTTVSGSNPFGSASNRMFTGCGALKEIHFRADAETLIKGVDGYSNKWGATIAQIIFDL